MSSSTEQTPETIAAGEFGEWLESAHAAVANNAPSDVPCGSCNACCRAGYFIHVTPMDVDAIAAIPSELLFAAPGAPPGYQLMGFDEQGHCPMLKDNACSIYASRPSACRSYDCRVFSAAGIDAGGVEKAEVNEQVLRWRFTYADDSAEIAQASVQRVAQVVEAFSDKFAQAKLGLDPKSASQVARFALERHRSCDPTLSDEVLVQQLLEG